MDTSTLKSLLAYLLSALLSFGGVSAIFTPTSQAETYGLPVPPSNKLATSYVQAMGIRNLTFGLSLFLLVLEGQRKAAGTVLSTACVIWVGDTWVTYTGTGGKMTAGVWSHIVVDGLFFAAGLWLRT